MNWTFWLGTLNAVLNVLFIADFFAYAVCGKSLAAFIVDDSGSLSDLLLEVYPGMSAGEFMASNGILLAFSCALLLVSIWIAYAGSGVIVEDSSCPCSCILPKKSSSSTKDGLAGTADARMPAAPHLGSSETLPTSLIPAAPVDCPLRRIPHLPVRASSGNRDNRRP